MDPNYNKTADLTKKEFNDKYWFSPLQMVTVRNPKATDFPFMVESRHFIINAGAEESFPGTVANVYLNQMTRILSQDEDKMQYLSDVNLLKRYYDRLIVKVVSMIQENKAVPEYLKDMPSHTIIDGPSETPPWQEENDSPVTVTKGGKDPKTAKAETKEFELNGLTFKSVTDEEGVTTFYKNDKVISEVDYAKAASMV